MQTYSNDWTATRAFFEDSCLLDRNELKLRQCIDEVDEPCELGCDGLSFCTNFNNRPTELFRSCNADADLAARSDLKMWQQNGSVILDGLELPIKNMTRCAPEQWKAIACALQIKPCTRDRHYNHICREDCYEILSECMDWTRMRLALNADSVCARLSPSDDVSCVSLRPYREESDVPKESGGYHGLTAPCKGHPCNASGACLARRNESNTYACVPGCRLGEASNYVVPFGAYVRIPVLQAEKSTRIVGDAATGAFKVCRCGVQGRIEHCQPLPSFTYANCLLPGGRSYEHGESFYLECNLCSCFAGEITCTKKQCRLASEYESRSTERSFRGSVMGSNLGFRWLFGMLGCGTSICIYSLPKSISSWSSDILSCGIRHQTFDYYFYKSVHRIPFYGVIFVIKTFFIRFHSCLYNRFLV